MYQSHSKITATLFKIVIFSPNNHLYKRVCFQEFIPSLIYLFIIIIIFWSKVYSFSRRCQASFTIWTNRLAPAWAWTGALSDTFPEL